MEKIVKKFGKNGAHLIVPKKWIDQVVCVNLKGEKEINWRDIEALIDDKIHSARNY